MSTKTTNTTTLTTAEIQGKREEQGRPPIRTAAVKARKSIEQHIAREKKLLQDIHTMLDNKECDSKRLQEAQEELYQLRPSIGQHYWNRMLEKTAKLAAGGKRDRSGAPKPQQTTSSSSQKNVTPDPYQEDEEDSDYKPGREKDDDDEEDEEEETDTTDTDPDGVDDLGNESSADEEED